MFISLMSRMQLYAETYGAAVRTCIDPPKLERGGLSPALQSIVGLGGCG
jgi:hypothetical protein